MTKFGRVAGLLRELADAFDALDVPEPKRARPRRQVPIPAAPACSDADHEELIHDVRRRVRSKGVAA